MPTETLLRRRDVETITGLSRSAIYLRLQQDDFPAPIRIGPQGVRWKSSDIQAWIESRPPAREVAG
ncbi:MAG: helix-turn-helix transcriptional regulator [Gammaproteobacteria bacterium]